MHTTLALTAWTVPQDICNPSLEHELCVHVLGAGNKYWIGLYETPHGWMWTSSRCTGNAYLRLSGIESAAHPTGNASGPSLWHTELSLDTCGAVSSTARLAEATCDWGGYRCLCELGAEALPEYLQIAKASRASGEKRARLVRMQVATIFSLAVALPLLMDKRLSSLLQRSVKVVVISTSRRVVLIPILTLTLILTIALNLLSPRWPTTRSRRVSVR